MVTEILPEIRETLSAEMYEPTVADQIQRVLYRLEHGERLGRGRLFDGERYCVLGLFANVADLPLDNYNIIYRHYGMVKGVPVNRKELPSEAAALVKQYAPDIRFYDSTFFGINDCLQQYGLKSDVVNAILAAIIRSGILFE